MTQAAVLTKSGRNLFLAGMRTGQSIQVNTAKITEQVLACTGDELDLPSVAFTMTTPTMLVYSPGANLLRFALPMSDAVGDFTIGSVGLFSGTTLVALAAFPNAGQKIKNALPTTRGNIRTLYVDLGYNDISALVNPLSSIIPPNQDPIIAALIYG